MRLPHHPEILEQLRIPTEEMPWKVLVSACIMGQPVAVDGSDYGLGAERPGWLQASSVQFVPFCPEDFLLGTPRSMPDLHGGDGFDVLQGKAKVLDAELVDITAPVLAGAEAMRDLALEHKVDFALLTDRSGACGSQVISVGTRSEEPVLYRKGVGVAAALLLQSGIRVVSHRDYRTLELLHKKLDPKHVVQEDALDHHEHPWVVENLG